MLMAALAFLLSADGGSEFSEIPWSRPPLVQADVFSFRGVRFGDSPQRVESLVGALRWIDNRALTQAQMAGVDVALSFEFSRKRLVRIACVVTEEHSSHDLELEDYERLRSALVQKYGQPTDQDNDDASALQIAMGRGGRRARWLTQGVEIRAAISGDNFKTFAWVSYTDSAFLKTESEATRRQRVNEF